MADLNINANIKPVGTQNLGTTSSAWASLNGHTISAGSNTIRGIQVGTATPTTADIANGEIYLQVDGTSTATLSSVMATTTVAGSFTSAAPYSLSTAVQCHGRPVLVIANGYVYSSGQAANITVAISRDTTTLATINTYATKNTSSNFNVSVLDMPTTAGTYLYSCTVATNSGTGKFDANTYTPRLIVCEL